jgi:hypothetical protein
VAIAGPAAETITPAVPALPAADRAVLDQPRVESPRLQANPSPAKESGSALSLPEHIAYIIPPPAPREGEAVYMITIVLRATGDKTRDVLRMRRIHGIASTYPGNDRLAFHVFERGLGYLVEFPNFTTGWSPELISRLNFLVGSENVRVEPITFQ